MSTHFEFANGKNGSYEVVMDCDGEISIRSIMHMGKGMGCTDCWIHLTEEDARNLVDTLNQVLAHDSSMLKEAFPDTREWLDRPNTAWIVLDFPHLISAVDLSYLLDKCKVSDDDLHYDHEANHIYIGEIPRIQDFTAIRDAVDTIQDRIGRRGFKACRLVVEYDANEYDDEESEEME